MGDDYLFERAIILGSGKLAFRCAVLTREHLADVEVLEYKITESTVLRALCDKEGILYRCCSKDELNERLMQEQRKCLVVSAANSYLIPQRVIEKENLVVINWHNALLPAHKGRNAEAWSIYAGDEMTGITWHMVTGDVDAGDIIVQEKILIDEGMTALKLYQRQCELGAEVYGRMLETVLKGGCRLRRQMPAGTEAMHYSWERPNDGYLETDWDSTKMSRFLRAMDYGGLLLLGQMHVRWEENEYHFHRYKISEKSGEGDSFADGNLTLHRGAYEIVLRGLKRRDGSEEI